MTGEAGVGGKREREREREKGEVRHTCYIPILYLGKNDLPMVGCSETCVEKGEA